MEIMTINGLLISENHDIIILLSKIAHRSAVGDSFRIQIEPESYK